MRNSNIYECSNSYKTYSISKTELSKLNKIISDIIQDDDSYSTFVNNIAVVNFNDRLDVRFIERVCRDKNDFGQKSSGRELYGMDNPSYMSRTPLVTFSNISKRQIGVMYSSWDRVVCPESYIFHGASTYRFDHRCINIDTDVRVSGTYLNRIDCREIASTYEPFYTEIYPLTHTMSTNSFTTSYKLNKILEFVFVGEKQLLMSFTLCTGTTYIRWPLFKAIWKKYGDDRAKEILEKIFTRIKRIDSRFGNIVPEMLLEQDIESMSQTIVNKVLRHVEAYVSECASKGVNVNYDHIVEKCIDLPNKVTEQLENVFTTQSKLKFSTVLNEILNTITDQQVDLKHKYYLMGVDVSNRMNRLGWESVVDPAIEPLPLDNGTMWFRKTVDIIPDRIMKRENIYRLPEEYRKWNISTLYISLNGHAKAVGRHPNVSGPSGGDACLNGLNIDISNMNTDIGEMLRLVETTMTMVNFDSAYRQDGIDPDMMTMENRLDGYTFNLEKYNDSGNSTIRKLGTGRHEFPGVSYGVNIGVAEMNAGIDTNNPEQEVRMLRINGEMVESDGFAYRSALTDTARDLLDKTDRNIYKKCPVPSRGVFSKYCTGTGKMLEFVWIHPSGTTTIHGYVNSELVEDMIIIYKNKNRSSTRLISISIFRKIYKYLLMIKGNKQVWELIDNTIDILGKYIGINVINDNELIISPDNISDLFNVRSTMYIDEFSRKIQTLTSETDNEEELKLEPVVINSDE